jgi:hypothetical protein
MIVVLQRDMISKLLSSSCQLQRQQKYNNKEAWHEDTVSLGIDFILGHIEKKIKSSSFPLAVTTYRTSNKQIIVYNKSEMLEAYRQSLFLDCTVSSTSQSKLEYYYTSRHDSSRDYDDYRSSEQKRSDKSKIIFDIILIIDLRRRDFETASGHIKALDSLLQNMKEYLCGSNPTVLWTGNSFSIYQPIRAIFSSGLCIEVLNHKLNSHHLTISSFFLSKSLVEFIARRIANYNSLYIPISTKPVLDIPGTLNSECIISRNATDPQVQIVQKWNKWRPKIDSMLMIEFYCYLKDNLFNCNKEGHVKERQIQQFQENGDLSYHRYYDRSYNHKEAIEQANYKQTEQRSFLICKSCFWCATSYCSRSLQIIPISRCPSCNRNDITELALNSSREELRLL